ncbi:hypothetical protein NA56DRAFT_699267 [Hyaloscypha hepaticicola]|uniref:Uncharacterized protein n=1 Tax=Hyaloscypha hepaticicola TaxID=2082293 RepID=A0A2J6QGD8_9HELO|nr:hypothetical protein NA56DRAFT_699267 [Hyaloscypha hepaticicola]
MILPAPGWSVSHVVEAPNSEPLPMHCPQRRVGKVRYLGTEYGTVRFGAVFPALVAAFNLCNTGTLSLGPAAYVDPEFLQQHRQKRELLSRQFGVLGCSKPLFEAAVLSGLSPSPSHPQGQKMKNSGVTVPFLKASSPTERPQPVQSLNLCSVQFVRHFLLRVVATNGRKMGN